MDNQPSKSKKVIKHLKPFSLHDILPTLFTFHTFFPEQELFQATDIHQQDHKRPLISQYPKQSPETLFCHA